MPEELNFDTLELEEKKEDFVGDLDEEIKKYLEYAKVNIKVVGVGGGGCNTINRLYEMFKKKKG
jgi:cell division GTPase FtsZ